jgi:predicted nucleic acid-binding protein
VSQPRPKPAKSKAPLALRRFEDQQDKGYSLTDCMSLFMGMNGVRNILTSDRHFTQAGFRILM